MPSPTTTLTPYTGPWTDVEISHLLKRTMFGAKKSDIDYFKTKTVSQAIDELVTITPTKPAPPIKDYVTTSALTPDNNIVAGTTWVNDPNTDGTINSLRISSFKKWWIGVMINQERSVSEKMTLFLHNHFSTETATVGNSQYVYKHHDLLRQYALGNFKTLTKQITIDPAMLVFLNGQYNTATAPDENYGRELQELFCCGKGVDSLYTEADVKAAAKVLTGWTNNSQTISSSFTISRHDKTDKQFSAFYNNTVITGRTDATAGSAEIDDMLTMIFNTNEAAKYICRCLYRWFIYYDITPTIETNIIAPLADIFRLNNFELKPVLSALFKSEHFFDSLNIGCQIKNPVDLVIGLCREFNLVFPASSDYASNYTMWNYLLSWLINLNQNIGDPPDVSGWKAYYQIPQYYELWINSDTLPKRNQYSDAMVMSGYTVNSNKLIIDGIAFAKSLPTPSDPNLLIDDSIRLLFKIDLAADFKAQIKKDILLGGQVTDSYWTTAWNTYLSTPSDTANTNIVVTRLKTLYKYFMNLAEYQLC